MIDYREAGDPRSPTILLLHGFPTSSHMFRDLIPLLADRYHLVAPDYPGFGYSALPAASEFNYTFEHLAEERTPQTEARLRELFELPATKRQYLEGAPDPSLVSPDSWEPAQWGMDRPGDKESQFALHSNYGSNVEHYEEWHAYRRCA